MNRIKGLIELLNKASHAYYNLEEPIMTDSEYDALYDELFYLESETGIVLTSSPTVGVGYEVVSKLDKVEHEIPLLSLNKTKEVNELKKFIGKRDCVLMLKMDGLTTKLEYEEILIRGSTRGDGYVGESITHNVKTFKNIPLNINDDLNVVGEAIITYPDFIEINSKLHEEDKYKNPRNLASGSVRQLDSKNCAKRNVKFITYGIQDDTCDTKFEQLEYLDSLGFEVVPYILVTKDTVEDNIELLRKVAEERGFAIDGLVVTYNDSNYGLSLGNTSKFPRHSLAFKFGDDLHETIFTGIETNTTRTGMVSLTGLFKSVEIDGTSVSRASLHNVDIFEGLQLGVGDTILVRKANMIIPQVMDNLTRSNTIKLPETCPACGLPTEIRSAKEARFLYCTNDLCSAKQISKIVHFVSRNAMNIMGLSEATIEKFVNLGIVDDVTDLYFLDDHMNEIKKLDGFGKKSYDKIITSIESSKEVYFHQFIYGLGIPNTGSTTSKMLAKHYNEYSLPHVSVNELLRLDDIGEVVANSIVNWFRNDENSEIYVGLIDDIGFNFKKDEVKESNITGKNFVVTGKLSDRKAIQKLIESLGGKVVGSVSVNTHYLINNDSQSSSSKNKKAKELGVVIITEEQFMEMINN